MEKFMVMVEYADGEVKEYAVEKELWNDIVYRALENDELVDHYIVMA